MQSVTANTFNLRLAKPNEANAIWEILQQAIARRKADGSNQWQDGYPNLETVKEDIAKNQGYVLMKENLLVGYTAVVENYEPAYEAIVGEWLSNDGFVAIHRVAISNHYLGKGLATKIFEMLEPLVVQKAIYSIKVDTNFDNEPMLRIFEKLNYSYCGKVYFDGSERRAFEKVLR